MTMSDDIYTIIDEQARLIDPPETPETPDAADKTPYNKDEYAARKKAERDEVYARIDQATERVTKDPAAFKDFLDTMARFSRYSVANTLLIFAQRPNATKVADFESWKRQGSSVKKGESAIAILEPGDEYTREDGSIGVSYNVKKVFDERQTNARHLKPRYSETRELLFALVNNSPVGIKVVDSLPAHQGYALYDNESKTISVVRGAESRELFRALATEFAHVALAERDDFYDRSENLETAQLAAYVVAGRYGADNSGQMPVFTLSTEGNSPAAARREAMRSQTSCRPAPPWWSLTPRERY